ncbi:hypothetical protein F2Q69_00017351 [Brassica cretica]|uniref:Uncharacterized protein n=1 Tax=Brassica cretica TaxID=69181 RepID=A0A8S9QXA0_BRACR|nr:hypothetical protein F2Q69_00017351 [Brassica cretica]
MVLSDALRRCKEFLTKTSETRQQFASSHDRKLLKDYVPINTLLHPSSSLTISTDSSESYPSLSHVEIFPLPTSEGSLIKRQKMESPQSSRSMNVLGSV